MTEVKHMKRIVFIPFMIIVMLLTACGSSESASAPDVASSDKAAVQEKLNKTDSSKPDDDSGKDADSTSSQGETSSGKKILVAFFSRADENYKVGNIEKGNTQIVAEYIAKEVGADSFHIETVTPYPTGYDECCDVAKQEQKDKARPEIKGSVDNIGQYDIVFLGYPIWWGDMPMAVYTFLEKYDLSDKVIIPFCTHEGSGLSGTDKNIAGAVPKAQVLTALDMRGATAQEFNSDTQKTVREWLDKLGF